MAKMNVTFNTISLFAVSCLVSSAALPATGADQNALRRVARTVAPSGIEEVCLPLQTHQELNYRFTASGELVFSMHYHEGERVRFPVPERATSKEEGSFIAELIQDYCLMWENRGDKSVDFELIYEKLDSKGSY